MYRVISILFLVLFIVVCPMASAEEKDWTWIVFLNADNNLDSFGDQDQQEMSKIGSNEWLNIVSLIDHEHGPAELNYIEKNNIKKIKDMGELDMGDYKLLVQFVKDTAAAYPAKHYALIIWNHGSGWKNSKEVAKGISYDDSSNNHITTEQLGIALKEIKQSIGKNLDIFSMDACLMQMMEVAYAIKDSSDFIVASEETEPGAGYPYDGILGALKKDMNPEEFCKKWVAAYAASYNGGSQGTSASTQSAIACAKLDALKDAIDGFAKTSIAGAFGQQFKNALIKVQKFYYTTNIDLLHLALILKSTIKDEAFQTAANKLELACNEAIVANGITGATMKNAKGLAIYFPTSSSSFASDYKKLAFAQASLWDEMVFDYYKKTTTQTIIADLQNSDMSSLIEYVKAANENNREISQTLITNINFSMYSEQNISIPLQAQTSNLLKELKNK